jgi:cytochrome d ubiquinol oxidase subunit I
VTKKGVPLYIVGFADEQNERTYGIYVPNSLSFLYNFDWNSEIRGLKEFPKENWPPVNFVFQTYHIMVGIGILSIAMGLLGVFLLLTKKIYEAKLYLSVLPFLIPLPHIAHETGWISAEVGRQPWIIYGLMKTADGASTVVSANDILGSLIMFLLVYLLLFIMFIMLFLKFVKNGPPS